MQRPQALATISKVGGCSGCTRAPASCIAYAVAEAEAELDRTGNGHPQLPLWLGPAQSVLPCDPHTPVNKTAHLCNFPALPPALFRTFTCCAAQ